MNRLDGKSNESFSVRFGMSTNEEISCGVIKMVKCITRKWCGHLERMCESDMTRRYMTRIHTVGVRE